MQHIVIIGNGVAGITTARHIRKKDGTQKKITVISDETDHYYSRPALMYLYMGHMKYNNIKPYEDWFWKKNKIDLVKGYVESIDTGQKQLQLKDGTKIAYDKLVVASGSKSREAGWPGQNLRGIGGMYFLQDVDYMETMTKGLNRAVIVGGGLIGIEMAEMFRSRDIPVTILVRHKGYWGSVLPYEDAQLINNHIREHHVDLKLETELKEILGDEDGNVNAVLTDKDEKISCGFVGLAIGVVPNIDFIKPSAIETDRGILVNQYLETNMPDVYAAGDCAQHRNPLPNRKPIEQVWYTARMMGEALAETLCGNKTAYMPGIWFNSAKFFDVEYHNYGWVFPEIQDYQDTFYWEHESGKKAIRFVYNKADRAVFGINAFGIRLKHEVCEQWIKNKITIEKAIENLEHANFDPEFFPGHEQEIRKTFNSNRVK